MKDLASEQREVCKRFGAKFDPPRAESKVGVALQTRGHLPLNALRHPSEAGTCGWYIWLGDTFSQDTDFFQPLHVEHLGDHCPEIFPYLALPPGWRVQVAPGHEDVWYDAKLLDVYPAA
jgi:hypothetical protein